MIAGRPARRKAVAAVVLMLGLAPAHATAAELVDLELVLLADASHSIDTAEVRVQRAGYAAAITDPEVLSVIAEGYRRRIAVTFVEWGGPDSQEVVVPWTIIDGRESAAAFARHLLARPRLGAGRNAIGNALSAARALIEENDIDGTRKVIDFSADALNSSGGIPVEAARGAALSLGMVINGLALVCPDCSAGASAGDDLAAAFAQRIIGGPGSFVIAARSEAEFVAAVRRKLLLEIASSPERRSAQTATR